MNKRRIEEVRCRISGQPIRFRFVTLTSPPFVFVMDGASVTQESTLVWHLTVPPLIYRSKDFWTTLRNWKVNWLICSTYIKDKYSTFTNTSVHYVLSFLRWTNLFTALIVLGIALFSIISYVLTLDVRSILLTSYCILFSALLFLFELHTKKINRKLRINYGFMFTYVGRSVFIFLYVEKVFSGLRIALLLFCLSTHLLLRSSLELECSVFQSSMFLLSLFIRPSAERRLLCLMTPLLPTVVAKVYVAPPF